MRVHLKIRFIEGGGGDGHEKPIHRGELPKTGECLVSLQI